LETATRPPYFLSNPSAQSSTTVMEFGVGSPVGTSESMRFPSLVKRVVIWSRGSRNRFSGSGLFLSLLLGNSLAHLVHIEFDRLLQDIF
jgi:hypothetical protein